MLAEIEYRTFDDVLNSVKSDLRGFSWEGLIDAQDLIKVAWKINSELGIRINPSKSKPLEIHNGKCRLPDDFKVLNYALLCEGGTSYILEQNSKTYSQGLLEGVLLSQKLENMTPNKKVNQYSEKINIQFGSNIVTHNLNSLNIMVQAIDTDGNFLDFDIVLIDNNSLKIISTSQTSVNGVNVIILGAKENSSSAVNNIQLTTNPDNGQALVRYNSNGKMHEYDRLIPLKLEYSKSITPDCVNLYSNNPLAAHIKNGFLVTNFDHGIIYINYQGSMEDDDGNLLTLDHPLVNDYYEYAFKERILENAILNDENVINKYQLIASKIRPSRIQAITFVRTPDFHKMLEIWRANRKAQSYKYIDTFKYHLG